MIAAYSFRDRVDDRLHGFADTLRSQGRGSSAWPETDLAGDHGLSMGAGGERGFDETVAADAAFQVVADAALCDRPALAAALCLAPDADDALLILAAYRRWGEACVDHLIGDFAFLLWDADRRCLFAARDAAGVKPLHWCERRGGIACSGAIDPLLHAGLDHGLFEPALADFLAGEATDGSATFHNGIRRLEPGHALRHGPDGLRVWRYWTLPIGPSPELPDAPWQLRELLRRAVGDRMSDDGRTGALLSGGLDSSSIACLARNHARRRPLQTVTLAPHEREGVGEMPFVEAVLATGGLLSYQVRAPVLLDALQPLGPAEPAPVNAPNLGALASVHHAARRIGLTAMLDGHGGDEVVSHGYERLDVLARERRLWPLWRECAGPASTFGEARLSIWLRALGRNTPSGSAGSRRLNRIAGLIEGHRVTAEFPGRFVDRGLARRTQLRDRLIAVRRTIADPAADPRERHRAALLHPGQGVAFDVLDRAARAAGIRLRFPFWDRRVVEFCVSLPVEAKLANGWSRAVLRCGMAGIVPQAVQRRRDKLDFTPRLASMLVNGHGHEISALLGDDRSMLAGFADLPRARAAWQKVRAAPARAPGNTVHAIWRTAALGRWLRQRESHDETDPGPQPATASALVP